MIKLAILCAALAAAPTFAGELVARQGSDTIRLADTACTSQPVLNHVDARLHGQFRAALAVVQGRTFTACWRMTPTAAHLVYEDGDQGLIPLTDLKRQLTA